MQLRDKAVLVTEARVAELVALQAMALRVLVRSLDQVARRERLVLDKKHAARSAA